MGRMVRLMKRPESMLAAGVVGLAGALGVLVVVTLTSCESESPGVKSARSGEGSVVRGAGKAPRAADRFTGEPEMRVRILAGVESVKVGTGGGGMLLIWPGDPKGLTAAVGAGIEPTRVRGPATVRVSGVAGWTVQGAGSGAAEAKRFPTSAGLIIQGEEAGAGLTVNGVSYPGTLRLSARTDVRDGAIDAVEFVRVEEYLPGVVAKEMLTGWPLGAYQAQSVAARTYALQERQRSIDAGLAFDVESSDRDQVYGGATTNQTAIQAVKSTRGQVLMDGDKLLRAYFSSTCGGRNASAKDTWPTGPGFEYNLAEPIQAHPRESACERSPLYRWTVERPRAELVARMRTFGEKNGLLIRKIKGLQAIEVMQVNVVGRPSRYKIIEPGGTWYQLSAEELRLACNTSVNAAAPAVGGTGGSAAKAPGKSAAPAQPLVMAVTPEAGGAGMVDDGGIAAPVAIPDVDRKTRVHSSDFEVQVVGERVIFTGRGFGHGVGLCQYCTKAWAERGEDWRVMMAKFYPGARIVSAY